MKHETDYHKAHNRCSNCAHRIIMHDLQGVCQVYNKEDGVEVKCKCRDLRSR